MAQRAEFAPHLVRRVVKATHGAHGMTPYALRQFQGAGLLHAALWGACCEDDARVTRDFHQGTGERRRHDALDVNAPHPHNQVGGGFPLGEVARGFVAPG